MADTNNTTAAPNPGDEAQTNTNEEKKKSNQNEKHPTPKSEENNGTRETKKESSTKNTGKNEVKPEEKTTEKPEAKPETKPNANERPDANNEEHKTKNTTNHADTKPKKPTNTEHMPDEATHTKPEPKPADKSGFTPHGTSRTTKANTGIRVEPSVKKTMRTGRTEMGKKPETKRASMPTETKTRTEKDARPAGNEKKTVEATRKNDDIRQQVYGLAELVKKIDTQNKQRLEEYKKERFRNQGKQDDKQNKQPSSAQIDKTKTYEDLEKTGIPSADPATINRILNNAGLRPVSIYEVMERTKQIVDANNQEEIDKEIKEYMRLQKLLNNGARTTGARNSSSSNNE